MITFKTELHIALVIIFCSFFTAQKNLTAKTYSNKKNQISKIKMKIDSEDLPHEENINGIIRFIPRIHTANKGHCKGENISPNMKWFVKPWNNIIKSFAITMYSPSAETGSGFWHWIIYNIPPDINEIETGSSMFNSPEIINENNQVIAHSGLNDFGKYGYYGPCPPINSPTRKYEVTVYALNVQNLPVDYDSPPAMVRIAILKHTVVQKSFTALY